MLTRERVKLFILFVFIAGFVALLLTNNVINRTAHAYSSGPPAGFTGAPGEFTCAECHVRDSQPAGQSTFVIGAPQHYLPGQTYQITITHTSTDPTRRRWGFELTALTDDGFQAGVLQSADNFTQVLNNQGPGNNRQYIEHTASGNFNGQQNGASWTFNWTAPATDVGEVVFYAAGNQANADGNTSGDFIYATFTAATPAVDFNVTASPPSKTVSPGGSATFNVTVTPSGGFTGQVDLSASGLPTGASASFNPLSVNLTDFTPQTSTLTLTTAANTPVGTYPITINGVNGSTQHSAQVSLTVAASGNAELSISKTASPEPATVGATLSYRIVVNNNGPATATNVNIADTLPSNVTFVSATPTQGTCNGTSAINCNLGNLSAGANAVLTIIVQPTATGQTSNTATVSATETDPNPGNNSSTAVSTVQPQGTGPLLLDPNLTVRTVASGLDTPTSMAFIGANDFFVLEKMTGKVQHIVNGAIQSVVLDLPVNGASERGLLGIALHPNFAVNHFVYLYWTESSTGADSTNISDVALLGNRVDRYVWNGTTLNFDRNLIRLRAFQADAGQPLRGNHNGGVLRFGPDGKLYILMGDNGRRGLLQNVTSGGPVPDDQYGGPEPDNAHLTGFILRLNDDGTTPADNPFFNASTNLTGEAAANIKKLYAYGVRNGFGMDFDPLTGNLWEQENGDDGFDEINRVEAGANNGWIQIMGALARLNQYKSIETTYGNRDLQQIRWSPTLIADTQQDALARLYMLPGAHYSDPEFSWKYAVAPSPIGFVRGRALGAQFEGNLFVGASRTTLVGGYLFRFKLSNDRKHIASGDSRLADMVADNNDKFDITESESLLIGRDFGVTTDIQTGPNGNLFIVSLSNGAVYEISAVKPTLFVATLNGAQETPPNNSTATGTATLLLSPDETTAHVSLFFNGLSSNETAAHIHGPGAVGVSAPVLFPLPLGQITDFQITLSPAIVQNLKNGLLYVNVHSQNFSGGEIRGQFQTSQTASSIQFDASNYTVAENGGSAQITVVRFGNTASPATVTYATSDGTASQSSDYTATLGTLSFAANETSKSFNVPITNDAYVEANETINLTLSNPTGGAVLGPPATATLTINDNDTTPPISNPIDDAQFFVRQHYLDFLNREPDAGGLAYWTSQITQCGANASCVNSKRVEVSAAFFIEQEFQNTGFFVYRVRRATLGLQPNYAQYVIDRSRIGLGTDQEKNTFINAWIQQPEFLVKYPASMNGFDFIDALIANVLQTSGVDLSAQRQLLRNDYIEFQSRARIVRLVAENPVFTQAEYNPAFVLAEYFGYLRRDADASGYQFWLNVLNNRQPNNYRGMVCAFITSAEYQQRFSPVVTRTNADCAGIH